MPGPPLVDANRHAFCQAIHNGIEGEDWGKGRGEEEGGQRVSCGTSSGWTRSAPWTLERYAEAREHLKFGSRKFRKGARM